MDDFPEIHIKKSHILLGVVGFFVLVIGLPLLFAAIGLINLPFLDFEKKVQLNQGVISQTFNTQYCLNNYHWFLETYQDIQQKQQQVQQFQTTLDTLKQDYGSDMSKWSFTAQQNFNETQSELTGVQNAVFDETGQYNARTQELDRVACKNLPLYIKP